jgi:MipA family protein
MKSPILQGAAIAIVLTAACSVSAEEQQRWGLGIGAVWSDNPYAGRDPRATVLPAVTYDGDRLFFRGIEGGVHLYKGDWWRLDALAGLRLDGIDAKDFGIQELARNGIDRSLLSDRDDSVDAGIRVAMEGRYGQFQVNLLADVLDKSGGFEAKARYGYPLDLTDSFRLTPYLGASYLSKDMTRYYYGTLDEEIARGVVSYKPDAAVTMSAGLSAQYQFAGKWLLIADLPISFLPNEISNSPLLDAKISMSPTIAVLRRF